MSEQTLGRKASRHVLGSAIAGVVFADFVGVLLFAVPTMGWLFGLITMLGASPLVAWVALEDHPKRNSLTLQIGVLNAVVLTVVAVGSIVLFVAVLSSVQFG